MNFFFICSLTILASGIVFLLAHNVRNKVSLIFLPAFFIVEIMGEFFLENNLILFSLAALIHFLYVLFFFFDETSPSYYSGVIFISVALYFLLIICDFQFVEDFSNELRLVYNFLILLLTSSILVKTVLVEKNLKVKSITMPFAIMFFFSLDFFLAIPFKFMINQSLELIAIFWFIRVLSLQIYYISIIYNSWKQYKVW